MTNRIITSSLMLSALLSLGACSDSKTGSAPYVDENGVTHAKHKLFDYECPTATSCTRSANTYITNIDGLFIELDTDYVEQCIEDKGAGREVSTYCKYMIMPGDTETFNSSAALIQHILVHGSNPAESENLSARMKAAKEKLYR